MKLSLKFQASKEDSLNSLRNGGNEEFAYRPQSTSEKRKIR